MGVHGLTTFVNQYRQRYKEKVVIRDSVVIIDGSNLMYHLYFDGINPVVDRGSGNGAAKSTKKLQNAYLFGGDWEQYAQNVRYFFQQLKQCKITGIVILDGAYDSTKMDTVRIRFTNSVKDNVVKPSRPGDAVKPGKTYTPIFLKKVFLEVLGEQKIPHYQTIGEADPTIAWLARQLGDVPILSSDSDFLIYINAMALPLCTLTFAKAAPKKTSGEEIDNKNSENSKGDNGLPTKVWTLQAEYVPLRKLCKVEFELKDPRLLPLAAAILGNDNLPERIFKQLQAFKANGNAQTGAGRVGRTMRWLGRQVSFETAFKTVMGFIHTDNAHQVSHAIRSIVSMYEGGDGEKVVWGYLIKDHPELRAKETRVLKHLDSDSTRYNDELEEEEPLESSVGDGGEVIDDGEETDDADEGDEQKDEGKGEGSVVEVINSMAKLSLSNPEDKNGIQDENVESTGLDAEDADFEEGTQINLKPTRSDAEGKRVAEEDGELKDGELDAEANDVSSMGTKTTTAVNSSQELKDPVPGPSVPSKHTEKEKKSLSYINDEDNKDLKNYLLDKAENEGKPRENGNNSEGNILIKSKRLESKIVESSLPDWYIGAHVKCQLQTYLLNLYKNHAVFLSPQVELYDSPSSHELSIPIIQVTAGLVMSRADEPIEVLTRKKGVMEIRKIAPLIKLRKFGDLPLLYGPLTPNEQFSRILTHEQRFSIVIEALGLHKRKEISAYIMEWPVSYRLWIATLMSYLSKKIDIGYANHDFMAVCIAIFLCIIKNLITNPGDANPSGNKGTHMVSLLKMIPKSDPKNLQSLRDFYRKYEDFSQSTSRKFMKEYDMSLVSAFSEYNCMLFHTEMLNNLLENPMKSPKVRYTLNNFFVYNFARRILERDFTADGVCARMLSRIGSDELGVDEMVPVISEFFCMTTIIYQDLAKLAAQPVVGVGSA